MTEHDIRFTTRDNYIYAFVMDWPTEDVLIRSMSTSIGSLPDPIVDVSLLGSSEEIRWEQEDTGLTIQMPSKRPDKAFAAYAFKIELQQAPDGIYRGREADNYE